MTRPAADKDLPDITFAQIIGQRAQARANKDGPGMAAWPIGGGPTQQLPRRIKTRFGAAPAWTQQRKAAPDQALKDWRLQNLGIRR